MAASILDVIHPVELTNYIRELAAGETRFAGPGSLEDFLPNQSRLVTEWSYLHADVAQVRAGRYRAFGAEAKLGTRPGFDKVSGPIFPITEKMLLSEADAVTLRTLLAQADARSQILRDQIFNDVERLTQSVLARIEYARATALTTGTVTFTNDEDLEVTIDFQQGGRSVGTNTASTLWSVTASADPIAYMRAQLDTYRTTNNDLEPVVGLTSKRVIDAMIATDAFKNYAYQNTVGSVPAVVPYTLVDQVLSIYGLPPLREYKVTANVAGTSTRFIDDADIVWLPAPDVDSFGETTFGLSERAVDMADAYGSDFPVSGAPGLVGRAWKENEPPNTYSLVDGVVIPVLKAPERIRVLTVLS